MYKVISELISKFSSITITDSGAVEAHLEKSGIEEFDIPKTARIIGMRGHVNSCKGQADFLKVANIVMSKHPDVYTVFIGAVFEGE